MHEFIIIYENFRLQNGFNCTTSSVVVFFYLICKNIRVSVMTQPGHTGDITAVKLSMGSNAS